MARKIQPKNWSEFQHYKDRSPPWIKLHKGLLDDFEFNRLPIASMALAPMLWLLASETKDGVIDADPEKLAFRLRKPVEVIVEGLSALISSGFFIVVQDDSEPLATCLQAAIPETERETESQVQTEGEVERAAIAPPTPPKTPVVPIKPEEPEIPNFLLREPNGTRWAEGRTVPPEWMTEAELKRKANDLVPVNLNLEAEKFTNHWVAKSGKDATKRDWKATWINWALAASPPRGAPFQREQAEILRVV